MHFPEIEKNFSALWGRLKQAKLRKRLGQAYLIQGDDFPLIEEFSRAWMLCAACTSPESDGSPCGHCDACTLLQHHHYPELYELHPQSKTRRITVAALREFCDSLSLSPQPGFLKIGVIYEAEGLNDEAQNAFLKTLEEPPKDTLLLLLSANPRSLLPTTKSRCQQLSLRQNRMNYSALTDKGLFQALALLHRNKGAAYGLAASRKLADLFGTLHTQAEEAIGELQLSAEEANLEPAQLKVLQEMHIAKIEAEYMRLRNEVTNAMQAWFLQQILAIKIQNTPLLPNPEMFQGIPAAELQEIHHYSAQYAEEDLNFFNQFRTALAFHVDEKLDLDALCLQITEKISSGASAKR